MKKLFILIACMLIGGSLFAYFEEYDEIPSVCPICCEPYLADDLFERDGGGYYALCHNCGHHDEFDIHLNDAEKSMDDDKEVLDK